MLYYIVLISYDISAIWSKKISKNLDNSQVVKLRSYGSGEKADSIVLLLLFELHIPFSPIARRAKRV